MQKTDTVFKAIAHPARREILSLLSISTRSVKELTAAFSISQPAISQHLRELRDAQLVASDRVGLERKYRLTAAPLKIVMEWSAQYRGFFDPAGHAWKLTPANAGPRRKSTRKAPGHGR
jgi:DNA-binding transcriptional ArsR family regulator